MNYDRDYPYDLGHGLKVNYRVIRDRVEYDREIGTSMSQRKVEYVFAVKSRYGSTYKLEPFRFRVVVRETETIVHYWAGSGWVHVIDNDTEFATKMRDPKLADESLMDAEAALWIACEIVCP